MNMIYSCVNNKPLDTGTKLNLHKHGVLGGTFWFSKSLLRGVGVFLVLRGGVHIGQLAKISNEGGGGDSTLRN